MKLRFTPLGESPLPKVYQWKIARACAQDEQIAAGTQFHAKAWIRTGGTCSPWSFQFTELAAESCKR